MKTFHTTFVALILALFVSTPSFAGKESGGGLAARMDDKEGAYLFDFLEAGIESIAYIDFDRADVIGAKNALTRTLNPVLVDLNAVSDKLNELHERHPVLAEVLLNQILSYRWNFVLPALMPIDDIGATPIITDPRDGRVELVQVAHRDNVRGIISINRAVWSELPKIHQVGLVIHEAIYALQDQLTNTDNSSEVRILTSYLFDPRYLLDSVNDIDQELMRRRLIPEEIERLTVAGQAIQAKCWDGALEKTMTLLYRFNKAWLTFSAAARNSCVDCSQAFETEIAEEAIEENPLRLPLIGDPPNLTRGPWIVFPKESFHMKLSGISLPAVLAREFEEIRQDTHFIRVNNGACFSEMEVDYETTRQAYVQGRHPRERLRELLSLGLARLSRYKIVY